MGKLIRIGLFLGVLSLAGCAFNRSDFVAGPNGKANPSDLSDAGKAVGDVVHNHGPSYRLNF